MIDIDSEAEMHIMRITATIKSMGHGRSWLLLMLMLACLEACAAPRLPPREYNKPIGTPKAAQQDPISLPAIKFTIQVGAFSTTERAARFAVGLQTDGLDAYYFIDTDGLFKVRFDRFSTKAAARDRALALKADGRIDQFYIVQPAAAGDAIDAQSTLRDHIVQTAHRFIGSPYRWGGASQHGGFDCSGLTMTVYRLNGLELPRNSSNQYRAGTHISRNILQKGDLVFFATRAKGRISHVGIYLGQGRFIHAPGKGKRIRVASLSDAYFRTRYMGARRYF